MKERVSKIISDEEVKPETITTLKKADGATEALADILIEQIDQAIATQKDTKTGELSSQSINDIAKKAAEQLNKFIDNPNKYTVMKRRKVKEEVRKIFNRLLAAVELCKKSNLRISWSNI